MLSVENSNLVIVAERIRSDDHEADRIGEALATALHCRRDREHPDRWQTTWGTKTGAGIARTILAALEKEAE